MKILFTDDCNMHEYNNPFATLVELSDYVDKEELSELEYRQVGVGRRGGDWKELLQELEKEKGITYTILKQDRMKDIPKWYNYWEYRVISGNY